VALTTIEGNVYNYFNDLHTIFSTRIDGIKTVINTLLSTIKTNYIDLTYKSYTDIYLSYKLRLENILSELATLKTSIESLSGADTTVDDDSELEEDRILRTLNNSKVLTYIYNCLKEQDIPGEVIDLSDYTRY
jgi:hypothetical protein